MLAEIEYDDDRRRAFINTREAIELYIWAWSFLPLECADTVQQKDHQVAALEGIKDKVEKRRSCVTDSIEKEFLEKLWEEKSIAWMRMVLRLQRLARSCSDGAP